MRNIYSYFVILILLSSCGGGGSSTPPVPTVSLSSSASEVEVGNTLTLTWSSTNATSCNASGSWTGTKGISGSEQITIGIAGPNNFSLSCSGESITSGSASTSIEGYRVFNGKVVDGYIRGATVFIDTNNNFTEDSDEPSVVSDNSGGFELRYANGTLLSLGGFDLDSANLLDNLMLSHPLSGHSETKVITPVTSLLIGMEDSSQLKAALGIDNSIDISILDPVANKGDGGVYDYLYEKGNQLTVLALALQNISNDINASIDTTQDYFAAIAAEVEEAYTLTQARVDIESEAFISEVLENVITAKTLSISNEIKNNISSALASVMPVIEVKSSDLLTQSTLNFATNSLQTDIVSIAKGEADEKLSQYQNTVLNLIASDQNIELGGLAPGISAIADSMSLDEDNSASINLLANDSYLGSASISITIGSASNGSISVSGGTATYTPNSNFNGTETIPYTITQGSQTSTANLSITINPVQDAPVINSSNIFRIFENQSNIGQLNAYDPDYDQLSYSVTGDEINVSNDGYLTLSNPADFESKNRYVSTVSVSDGIGTIREEITIEIMNLDELHVKTYYPMSVSEYDFNQYNEIDEGLVIEEIYTSPSGLWDVKHLTSNIILATEQSGKFHVIQTQDDSAIVKNISEEIDIFLDGQGGLFGFDFIELSENQFRIFFLISILTEETKSNLALFSLDLNMDNLIFSNLNRIFTFDGVLNNSCHFGGAVRIVNNNLFLSHGDRCDPAKAQESDSHFGKIHRFDITNGYINNLDDEYDSIFSSGHRNIQGIEFASEFNNLIASEHGPQGGDEVNLLEQNVNYGWPLVTTGEEYGGGQIGVEQLDGYKDPITYYIPSIAPRDLAYKGSTLINSFLNNSIIITSLKYELLLILRIDTTRPRHEILDLSNYGRISGIDINSEGIIFISTNSAPGKILKIYDQ